MSSTLDPHEPRPTGKESAAPDEEHVDSQRVHDAVDTEPEEARNATDGYAPADDDADPITVDDLAERERLED